MNTGQYFDSETGLYYNINRYYAPELGRYLQPDPLGLAAGPNLYAYGLNNPLGVIDPTGLDGASAAAWAISEIGSTDYSFFSKHPDAVGRIMSITGGRGSHKCNAFVSDALKAGGDPAGLVAGGRIPLATEWADPSFKIPGYQVLPAGTPLRLGDVMAAGGHVGLYVPLPGGQPGGVPGTISATSPISLGGAVVHRDWGFRGDEGPVTVRRCECDM